MLTLTLNLTLTFDLSTARTISLVDHHLHQVWTLWGHSFVSYAADNSAKMHLLTMWPWSLTFELQNIPILSRISQDHSVCQVWTLWDHSFSAGCTHAAATTVHCGDEEAIYIYSCIIEAHCTCPVPLRADLLDGLRWVVFVKRRDRSWSVLD